MASREIFKKFLAGYKRFEKLFFKADKIGDKASYIKLKYQFRMISATALLTILISISMQILYGQSLSTPIPLLASVLIGFRFKWYNLPRTMIFIVGTIIPIRYYTNDLILAVPATIVWSNAQIMVLTQSQFFTLAHLILQSLIMYLYGMECLTKKLKNMTAEEITKIAQAAFYVCLMAAWVHFLMMQRFYAHVSTLLRKIGALWENITKANSQLNDQNRQLQSNLEMKDIFIYTFSHELKNALNGLLGNLTLAYETAKDSQILQFLSSAKVCGEVLKNFVHNILDSGKLENGNLEVSPERKDVLSVMENIWAICGRIIENKRLKGCLEIDKNVPRYLDLDEQRMIQIILNLVSNACKFTEKGNVRVHVSWQTICAAAKHDPREDEVVEARNNYQRLGHQEEKEADYCRDFQESLEGFSSLKRSVHLATERQKKFLTDPQFYQLNLDKWLWNHYETLSSLLIEGAKGILRIQVFDTGCGMTAQDQAMLFKKFSQTSRAPGQRKVGTGLGLWISQELAKGLDGEIKTRSVVGVGSVFELAVRTKVSHTASKPHNRPSYCLESGSLQARVTQKPRPPNTLKILIADDDSFNIELMKNYLNKFGIGYICAYDGEEAVSLFKAHYQDICFFITDNHMPKKLGTEAALDITTFLKRLKKPKIPIMCISGDVKVHVGDAGITSVIQKPINFDRLKKELMLIYPQISHTNHV